MKVTPKLFVLNIIFWSFIAKTIEIVGKISVRSKGKNSGNKTSI